ncbi:MAG TPA: diguanylate cyclase, partial [Sphingomicrobium sp.]|nr:diguanylate cyclase [Sphingomicrobium sp.]
MITSDSRRAQWRAVALPAAITLLLLAAVVGSILHIATSKADQLALEHQKHMVDLAIEQSVVAIANDQEASTYWDDAVLRTRERPLDLEWLDNNLGIWFHTFYHHDETYLIDPASQPIYAMRNGARAELASFQRVAPLVMPSVSSLRKKLLDGYVAPEGSPGQTVGVSAIVSLSGRPAIVSVKPIVSETGDIEEADGPEYLHVSVRYLDGSFLERLSKLYGIDQPRFEYRRGAEGYFPVRGPDGSVLGYINWEPFNPGEQVEDKMVPALSVALIVIGILLSFLLSRVRRSRMELEASRTQAQHLAFHDSLTGLPNRSLFEDRLEHALARRERRVAVLLLDLDRFKNVNDTLGHQAGDALIREFGLRLSSLTRDADTIARLGGDEFAILIEDAEVPQVQALAARIIAEIGRPFELFGNQAYVGVSIGGAFCTEAGM